MRNQFKYLIIVCALLTLPWVAGTATRVAGTETPVSTLYQSAWFSRENGFTSGIEGPSVDAQGFLYVMNFEKNGTVGRLAPDGSEAEIFAVLPSGSRGNGSRIDASGRLFIADYKKHNVLVIEKGERKAKVHFHSDLFSQPNDLALSKNGTLFASDPNWAEKTGRIWRIGIDQKGQVLHVSRTMGTTNGLDLSPDESKLYVSESIRREVWSYDLSPVGELKNPHLLIRFSDASIDGLRTDIDGNIFVARIEKGTIAQLNLTGVQIREIKLKGREPSNLAFGGADGKTVFVTQNDGRRIESFKVERPGREWCMLHAVSPDCKLK